jgi:septum formation protein
MSTRIVLASTSRYRRELLARAGLHFEVLAPQVDETPRPGEHPATLAQRLALAKAQAGLAQAQPAAGERVFVIGSDQVIDHAGQSVGKPGNAEQAIAQLQAMRGAQLTVCTGVAVASNVAAPQEALDRVLVQLRSYSDADIRRYVAAEQPFDCAGAIKSEALGQHLIERIESADPASLIGLPMLTVLAMLRSAGLDTLALATGAAHD